MLTTTRDIFPIQGARETAEEVKRIYKAYSEEDNFSMVEDDTIHAYTQKNLEALYAFFQKFLDNPGDPEDLRIEPLSKEELKVTAKGQITTSIKNAETIFSLNLKEVNAKVSKLNNLRKSPNYFQRVLKYAKELSGFHNIKKYHNPVFIGRYKKENYSIEKYFVKGEGDYIIPYLLVVPKHPNGKAVISLNPEGKSAE